MNKITIASEKLLVVIDEDKSHAKINPFIIILAVSFILLSCFYIGIPEFLIFSFFLTILFFGINQVTEIHFNKTTKNLYTAYSFFGQIILRRKQINDYTICHYSIVYEGIPSVESDFNAYTLRATEFYYHYNLYHFKNLDDAELVAHWLVKNAGITFEEYNTSV